ncbi:hypothetical protein A1O3_00129 [Capronia epimyces CBS 606.96]|uniref:Uncharacterized protein n=1 Tax=Capronia epimyces CBS 606.96 TaxID=1182542 RepID=W9YQP0_9EURO|nr:uncharacterized protein A1O3_00129 [Capronia epimyces CBS 606.96]EXJ91581.1 hypothetical protein A1O3_00129 [Capronia epimyces CBS 606.96]
MSTSDAAQIQILKDEVKALEQMLAQSQRTSAFYQEQNDNLMADIQSLRQGLRAPSVEDFEKGRDGAPTRAEFEELQKQLSDAQDANKDLQKQLSDNQDFHKILLGMLDDNVGIIEVEMQTMLRLAEDRSRFATRVRPRLLETLAAYQASYQIFPEHKLAQEATASARQQQSVPTQAQGHAIRKRSYDTTFSTQAVGQGQGQDTTSFNFGPRGRLRPFAQSED